MATALISLAGPVDVHNMNMVARAQISAGKMQQQDIARSRAMLDILDTIDQGGEHSQRGMATLFGVALGLVNAYLKICVKKGYVKVRRLPSRRYAYLLTPKGAAEKLRLSFFLLSSELDHFRHARAAYADVFSQARHRGWRRIVLVGASELAEISAICALESEIEIVALVDHRSSARRLIGLPVMQKLADVDASFDAALITDLLEPLQAFESTVSALGMDRVRAPAFFGFSSARERAA